MYFSNYLISEKAEDNRTKEELQKEICNLVVENQTLWRLSGMQNKTLSDEELQKLVDGEIKKQFLEAYKFIEKYKNTDYMKEIDKMLDFISGGNNK